MALVDIYCQRKGLFGRKNVGEPKKIATVNPRVGTQTEVDINSETGMGIIGQVVVERQVGLTIASVSRIFEEEGDYLGLSLVGKNIPPLEVKINDPLFGGYEITVQQRNVRKKV